MEHPDRTSPPGARRPPAPVQRWRITLAREALVAEAARSAQAEWDDAVTASGLPAAGLDASGGRARLQLAAPLGPGIAGEAELADLRLVARLPAWQVRERLASVAPRGWSVVAVEDVWLGAPSLQASVTAATYRIDLAPAAAAPPDPRTGPASTGGPSGAAAAGATVDPGRFAAAIEGAVADLLAAEVIRRTRTKRGGEARTRDLRALVADLMSEPGPDPGGVRLRATLRHDPLLGAGRPEELVDELGERSELAFAVVAIVRERLHRSSPGAATARPEPGG